MKRYFIYSGHNCNCFVEQTNDWYNVKRIVKADSKLKDIVVVDWDLNLVLKTDRLFTNLDWKEYHDD